jgi:hypothetical protein
MSEMTVEEAVKWLRASDRERQSEVERWESVSSVTNADDRMFVLMQTLTRQRAAAHAALLAHAERTVAARSVEPDELRAIREFADKDSVVQVALDHIDHLATRLAEVEAQLADTRDAESRCWARLGAVAQQVTDLRADRDALAACVERVRGMRDKYAECWDGDLFQQKDIMADILAALTPTREGA